MGLRPCQYQNTPPFGGSERDSSLRPVLHSRHSAHGYLMPYTRRGTTSLRILVLWILFCSFGCGGVEDQILIKNSPNGTVFLQQVTSRGATVRYSGPLKSFKANHPVTLAPDLLSKALAGIQIGILPSERMPNAQGIKPIPLFTAQQVAFLSPAIASALQQAEPDQRIRFQVGSDPEQTDGTLYVSGSTLRLAVTRYRSSGRREDGNLSIYTLSFRPEEAQAAAAGPQTWMEIEPDLPRVAIDYTVLVNMPGPGAGTSTILSGPEPDRTIGSQASPAGGELDAMKTVVDKQAQELQSLKAELEALKKQLQDQTTPSKPKPARKPASPPPAP